MKTLLIYPRGYTTGSADAPIRQLSSGDLVVDSLYDYLGGSRGNPKNWNYHSQVLDLALVLFGDFQEWFDNQLSNPALKGSHREYLLDTAAFINGERRRMSHASWSFILDEIHQSADSVNFIRHNESTKYLKKELTTIQILQQWCSRPEGINDLLTTMHVLFGHVGRTPA